MSANDKQVGGDHYQEQAIQPWDYIVANNIGYLEGNVIKYVSRWRAKNGLQDLEKARHYLDKLIEVETSYLEDEQYSADLEAADAQRQLESPFDAGI